MFKLAFSKNRTNLIKLDEIVQDTPKDLAKLQESIGERIINLSRAVWKLWIFERNLEFRIFEQESDLSQKLWQVRENNLDEYYAQFSLEFRNKIKKGGFHLKKPNFSVFITLGHPVYGRDYF